MTCLPNQTAVSMRDQDKLTAVYSRDLDKFLCLGEMVTK